MKLKEKMMKQTNEAVKETKKKAKKFANKMIKELPKNISKASEKGFGRVSIRFYKFDEEEKLAMEIVEKWAEEEKFKTWTTGHSGCDLVIEWKETRRGMRIKR